MLNLNVRWRKCVHIDVAKTSTLEYSNHIGKVGYISRKSSTREEGVFLPVLLEDSVLDDSAGNGNNTSCERCQPSTEDEAGNMKLCLQYFHSVRQLRISLYGVKNLREQNSRLVTKVTLLGSKGQTKRQCSSKQTDVESHSATFNENMYLKLKKEDFSKCYLRISLFEISTRRAFFKRSTTPIGGVALSLDGIDLDLDTALEVKLTSPERLRKVINGEDIKISKSDTLEEEARKLVAKSAYTPKRSRSTGVIRSLPVFIHHGATSV